MSFQAFLFLATVSILLVRWVLYAIYEETDDGPSFFVFMLDRNSYPEDRFRHVTTAMIVAAIIIGYFVVE